MTRSAFSWRNSVPFGTTSPERTMASDATIRRVARPRGELTTDQLLRLASAASESAEAASNYRLEVVAVLAEGASFAEVSKATGLSTNTLQRWKREAAS